MPKSIGRYVPHALGVATALGLAGLLLASDPGKPPPSSPPPTPSPDSDSDSDLREPTPTPIANVREPTPTPTADVREPTPTAENRPPTREGPFVCDREATHHVLERLRPEPGTCEGSGSCVGISNGFSNLDLDALCPATLPVSPQPTRAELAPLRLAGEEIRCTRRLSMFACSVTCFHETRGETHEALRERYADHVQWIRDRYGAESDASRQGPPSYPREQHRWREGSTTLSIDLHSSVCPPHPDHEQHASYRTHYMRTRAR